MATSESQHRVWKQLKSGKKDPLKVKNSVSCGSNSDLLDECSNYYNALSKLRNKRARCRRYALDAEGQWSDKIKVNRKEMTEAEYISSQGRTPLQHNLIRQCTKTLTGLFRQNRTQAVSLSNDRKEQKIGEMMSMAIDTVEEINQAFELDAANILEMMIGGVCCSRVGYNFIPALQVTEVTCTNVSLPYLFFNQIKDIRTWDLRIVGQLHDYEWGQIKTMFCRTTDDLERVASMFARYRQSDRYTGGATMTSAESDRLDFYTPSNTNLYRIIEVWRLETMEFVYAHDLLKGEEYWYNGNLASIEQRLSIENATRAEQALSVGIEPELIEYRRRFKEVWYYRFMTPLGEIIKEGRSPYWHEQHPFEIRFLSLYDGEPHSIVEDIIPQNRILNRYISTWDFIVNTSAKNTLAIAEGTIPEEMSIAKYAEEYRKVGGVILYRPLNTVSGGGAPQEISSNSRVVGMSEMITLMQSMIENISGVHPALQGQSARAGTSGKLYEQESTNAAIQHVDLIETFNAFRLSRTRKTMKTIQQYWDPEKFVKLCGDGYQDESVYYDSQKVKEADLDLSLSEASSTSAYRSRLEDPLIQLLQYGLPLKLYLQNTSLPFADKMLQQLESMEQGNAQQAGGIGQDIQQQASSQYGSPDQEALQLMQLGMQQ